MTVNDVIEAVLKDSCGDKRLEKTCDILVSGDGKAEVKGVATSFMATVDVINRAKALGANMIITHEPTYFTGPDRLDWGAGDPVYEAKRKLLESSGMAVWRYHDHMHMARPDRIYEGLLDELGWRDKLIPGQAFSHAYEIEAMSLYGLARFFKDKLCLAKTRIIGKPDATCRRVGILVGGGSLGLGREEMPMQFMKDMDIDVVVCGEVTEWTLCSYINDAAALGLNKSMIIVGHERTEEWGMKRMAKWLPSLLGGIPVSFVNAGEPFSYI
jgi:putative NIF3 family GTP cyclohydrolase 1 type 2